MPSFTRNTISLLHLAISLTWYIRHSVGPPRVDLLRKLLTVLSKNQFFCSNNWGQKTALTKKLIWSKSDLQLQFWDLLACVYEWSSTSCSAARCEDTNHSCMLININAIRGKFQAINNLYGKLSLVLVLLSRSGSVAEDSHWIVCRR